MHTVALQLAPILGAEKSKTPFYIAGGLLVAWALLVSLGIGMRRSDFPSNLATQRVVMAISALLVLGAVSTAVITSGGAATSQAANVAGALQLATDPSGQLSYDNKQLSAKAGSVSITLTNSSPLEHNLTIAQGGTVFGATPTFVGASKTLTVTLKPGRYTFYCSVPGHRQAGMEGTLTVS